MRILAAVILLHLVLVQPNFPPALTWSALWRFPLELPAIILLMIALGTHPVRRGVQALLTVSLTLVVVLKTADLVSFNALSRSFNPVADFPLIDAFVRLLAGNIGPVLTGAAILGAVLVTVLVAVLIWAALGVWSRAVRGDSGRGPIAGGAAVLAVGAWALVAVEVAEQMEIWEPPTSPPGIALTARIGVERAVTARQTLAELRDFRAAMANDPFTDAPGLFAAIDRDVLIIFVESYGRTSLDTPYYADVHRETLGRYEAQLRDAGLSLQSGILGSPTHGGQSWLAHSTIANGMWIDNQVSYQAILASGRETLYHHAANNGFHTATVMPQITLDWPEADLMGFDTVLPFDALGYEGLPFNWVTTPDQFTLSRLDRLLRDPTDRMPLFVQVALISSHAPWVPVPEILPWDAMGDGTVFNEIAASGDTPAVVWRDRERVRFQYRLAVDYALQSVFEYALLHADTPPLMLIVGDHQTATHIGLDDRREVPLHVIGPAHLVTRLSTIAPASGLLPGADLQAVPMDAVRDLFLEAFTALPPVEEGG